MLFKTIFPGRTICFQDPNSEHLALPGKKSFDKLYRAPDMMKERYGLLNGEEWMHFILLRDPNTRDTLCPSGMTQTKPILGDKIGHPIRNYHFSHDCILA